MSASKEKRSSPVARAARFSPLVARKMVKHFETKPNLRPEDAVMLTIQGLARHVERSVLPRGRGLRQAHFRRCAALAADAVVRGLSCPPQEWFGAMKFYLRRFGSWLQWMGTMPTKISAGEDLAPEDATAFSLWWTTRQRVGLKRDFDQFFRAAEYAHTALDQPDDRCDRLHTLLHFRRLAREGNEGIFVGRDGRLRLGPRQLRDTLASAYGIPRRRPKPPVPLEQEPESAAVDMDAVEAADQIRRVRAIIRLRLTAAEEGSVHRVVLQEYEALKSDTLTLRALASRSGRARSALQRAFQKEDAAICKALGVFPGN